MRCYYEELGLAVTASIDEINKAYKKLALKYHPDKNVDNAEEAKNKFLEIQKAHQVLSDPHERAWYDRNKDTIELEEISGNFVNPSTYHNTYVFNDYDDSSTGFYTIYRVLFQSIVEEELLFDKTRTERDYPVFGYKDSDFETVVKPFYIKWSIFQTKKSFSWCDEISETQGSNRQEVRHIKKLNSKNRHQQIKLYNESVRALVLFLKKRDKRIPKKTAVMVTPKNEIKKQPFTPRPPNIVDWQSHYDNILGDLDEIDHKMDEFLRDSHQNKVTREFDGIHEDDMIATLEFHSGFVFTDENDPSNIKSIQCMLCGKNFKNLATFLSHIKSKKHLSNIKANQRMKSIQKYLDENFFTPPTSESDILNNIQCEKDINIQDPIVIDENIIVDGVNIEQKGTNSSTPDLIDTIEDIHIKENDVPNVEEIILLPILDTDNIITQDELNSHKKKNKPKKKSPTLTTQSKASQTLALNTENNEVKPNFECQICHAKFPSNTKLFTHIKDKGHAVLKYDNQTKKKQKKRV